MRRASIRAWKMHRRTRTIRNPSHASTCRPRSLPDASSCSTAAPRRRRRVRPSFLINGPCCHERAAEPTPQETVMPTQTPTTITPKAAAAAAAATVAAPAAAATLATPLATAIPPGGVIPPVTVIPPGGVIPPVVVVPPGGTTPPTTAPVALTAANPSVAGTQVQPVTVPNTSGTVTFQLIVVDNLGTASQPVT